MLKMNNYERKYDSNVRLRTYMLSWNYPNGAFCKYFGWIDASFSDGICLFD